MASIIAKTAPAEKRARSHPLVDEVELLRAEAFGKSSAEQRGLLGQFATPPAIARQMASMFSQSTNLIRLLDAGAGAGSLTAAFVASLCNRSSAPASIEATAFEVDRSMTGYLSNSLILCQKACEKAGIHFEGTIRDEDFIKAAVELLDSSLFGRGHPIRFDCAILNPPYKKISASSEHRRLLRRVGIETSNLYTAFLGLAIMLLNPGGGAGRHHPAELL